MHLLSKALESQNKTSSARSFSINNSKRQPVRQLRRSLHEYLLVPQVRLRTSYVENYSSFYQQ